MRWLAYAHPVWMVLCLLLAGAVLREGLALRRARTLRRPAPPGARRRHLLLARPTLALIGVGFLGGLISAVWLRGFSPLRTFHALLACLALGLFLGAGRLGARLERGDASARVLHARLGAGAVLVSIATAIAGFVLLP